MYSSTEFWYVIPMEYYVGIQRNEALIHTTTWINLGNIMLSKETSQKYHILYDSVRIKPLVQESRDRK